MNNEVVLFHPLSFILHPLLERMPMADGKWITGLTAGTPVADAARRVLAVRLEVVRDYLPLALHAAARDQEYVHQLRVGTRRAGAAVEIFGSCLPDRVYRTARRQLRSLRRAAGDARDWDVFIAGLAERQKERPEQERGAFDFLLGNALGQRMAAQTRLEAASPPSPFGLDRLIADVVAAVGPPSGGAAGGRLIDLARPRLGMLVHELHQGATRDLDNYDHLHQVRIIGKRLRYAMEIFAECFDVLFREQLYPAVEEMQEILGHANDSHVACQRLFALRKHLQAFQPAAWKRFKPGVEGLLRYHQRRVPRQQKLFLKWWERWQKTGSEALLASLLQPKQVAPVLN
jgi:CHAD domain-containing protein